MYPPRALVPAPRAHSWTPHRCDGVGSRGENQRQSSRAAVPTYETTCLLAVPWRRKSVICQLACCGHAMADLSVAGGPIFAGVETANRGRSARACTRRTASSASGRVSGVSEPPRKKRARAPRLGCSICRPLSPAASCGQTGVIVSPKSYADPSRRQRLARAGLRRDYMNRRLTTHDLDIVPAYTSHPLVVGW